MDKRKTLGRPKCLWTDVLETDALAVVGQHLGGFAQPPCVLPQVGQVGKGIVVRRDPGSDPRCARLLQRRRDPRQIFESRAKRLFVFSKIERKAGLTPHETILPKFVGDGGDVEVDQFLAEWLHGFVPKRMAKFNRFQLVCFHADRAGCEAGEHLSRHQTKISNFSALYFVHMNMRFCLLLCAATMCAETMPKGMRVSTWVREDIFAGFLDNDLERFQRGMKKADDILAADPNALDALCWRAGGEYYLAVRAAEAGDKAKFKTLHDRAEASFAQAKAMAEKGPRQASAVYYIILGGTLTIFADRLPEELRRPAWERVKLNYGMTRELQKDVFDRMPVHHRGEVLSGMAQAALRLGDEASATTLLETIITTLPSTPYEPFAKKALATMDAKAKIACLTCHDAGRLANWKAPAPKAD